MDDKHIMKITKEQLRRVIQEELENVMGEAPMATVGKKLQKFVGDYYGGSKSKTKKSDKGKKKKDTLDEEINDPGSLAARIKMHEEKLKSLFESAQNHSSRLAKVEEKVGLRGRPMSDL